MTTRWTLPSAKFLLSMLSWLSLPPWKASVPSTHLSWNIAFVWVFPSSVLIVSCEMSKRKECTRSLLPRCHLASALQVRAQLPRSRQARNQSRFLSQASYGLQHDSHLRIRTRGHHNQILQCRVTSG
ncbi:hypothetical protein BV20DRAFT_87711 [Pilatotrama ljubarskyi]|nr:hypothetical protein BV20DRAFT_87711 [Pilatotrama ljubarskyi]